MLRCTKCYELANNCVCNLVVLSQRHYKTLCVCDYQSALWRQCVLVLYGLRVWFKH